MTATEITGVPAGAVSASRHHPTGSTQSSRRPAGDADRAAEAEREADQLVLYWNPNSK